MRHAHHRSVPRFRAAAAVVALAGALVVAAIVAAPPSWATDGWSRHTPSDPVLGGSGNQLMQSVASTAVRVRGGGLRRLRDRRGRVVLARRE